MTTTKKTDVIIVGAGPVGLTLSMVLARQGRDVTVLEQRNRGEPPSVKCNHVSARSMEIFRRLGIVSAVRNAGLPEDFPNDVSFRTSMTGPELARVPIPGRRDRYTSKQGPDTSWPTPEPPHRINQIYLEPILFERAEAEPGIRILNRILYHGFEQSDEGVTVSARHLDSQQPLRLEARYLVGCDGGRSTVRRQIGAALFGDAVVQRVQSTYIQAPRLKALQKVPSAWSMMALNPSRSGTVYAIDGLETWLIHNYLRPEEEDFESVDRDRSIRTILGVDDDFEYRIINKEDWFGRRLVADRFRDRRVFICGDASHIWVPYAGYGMNAGIADAENLGWLLAATLNGWAPPSILDAHEAERLPITEQVSHFAMNHAHETARQRKAVPADIEEDSAKGEALRAELGERAYRLNVQQYCCGGLNFGYYYDHSPIIAYDGETPPAYGMADFTPSTVPGCRTPHFWLADGRSLYDAMGDGYCLLRFDATVDVEPLRRAASRRRVPFSVLDVETRQSPVPYREKLVLSRPDRHVAWRGDRLPRDVLTLLDRLRGAVRGGAVD